MVTTKTSEAIDWARVRDDFPILSSVNKRGQRLVFLDSAASSQKPVQVLEAMDRYYEHTHANVHRAAYTLAEEATNAMEHARAAVARFIGADRPEEIVFTKNATEAINLVARSWGAANLVEGDTILLTQLEHHANIVPWQQLAAERGLEIRWIPLTDDGQLDLTGLDRLMDGIRLLGISAMSNVVGTITPVRQLADAAHAAGAVVAVDACQYVPHVPTDVGESSSPSFTTSSTQYVPGASNACTGSGPVALPPSSKNHWYGSGAPSGSLLSRPSNGTGRPTLPS